MFFRAWNTAIDDMGYALSRLEIDPDYAESESSPVGDDNDGPQSSSQNDLDHEIAQQTKLRSAPNERLKRVLSQKEEFLLSTVKMLAGREGNYSGRGRFSSADSCHILNKYLPVKGPSIVDHLTTRAYVSQFSNDGSLFVAAFQKNIVAKSLQWTITDTSLSPDKRFLVYATMSPVVNIVNIESAATESHANVTEIHEGLEFSGDHGGEYSFGIFSVKFSNDGRELVAGSNDDSIYVYDIEANKLSLRIQAHMSDVNSVCFADETSHLIYSGIRQMEILVLKIWDRRCLRSRGKPAGILVGHLEGITFIDSRNDGRYFISNGKDQSIKLWDIRKMSSNAPRTGQKYIYTGSHDSCVYIYDLVSGAQVGRLLHHKSTIRDCSWHPYYPTLVSSSFDGGIAKWELPGNGEFPIR
ncbi:hypothetical protein R6Q57_017424 [Mikania cordata]